MIEPQMINRSLVLVKPKKAFYDWCIQVFPDDHLIISAENTLEYTSYLLNEDLVFEDQKKVLKKYWEFIFEEHLFSVCINDSEWPEKLTWKLFTDWFECSFSSMIIDLEKGGIVKEEY
jgi:hypothetical protein